MRTDLEYRYGGEGTRKSVRLPLLFTEFPVRDVKRVVRVCVRRQAFGEEAVRAVLSYRPRRMLGRLDLFPRPELALVCGQNRGASVYDALQGKH